MNLKLYGSEYCHLCDEAEAVLREIGVAFEYADIADDDRLVELYGMRIPVLRRADTGAEVSWPFDADIVSRFLNSSH
jgi:glutaredoxin-related protein